MKKWFLLLPSCLLLFCTSCTWQANIVPTDSDQPVTAEQAGELKFWLDELPPPEGETQPVFYLDELPELDPYLPMQEIALRYQAEKMERLQPGTEYGKLYPYVGKITKSGVDGGLEIFGLCDATGKIVTDPIFKTVTPYQSPEGESLLFLTYLPRLDPTGENMLQYSALAAADGTWVLDDLPGILRYTDSECIILQSCQPGDPLAEAMGIGEIHTYDRKGTHLATIPQASYLCYLQGRYFIQRWETKEENSTNQGEMTTAITDANGTALSDANYTFYGWLNERTACIADRESDLRGLLGTTGIFITPRYDTISYLAALDQYVASKPDGEVLLLRADGSPLCTLLTAEQRASCLDAWCDQGRTYFLLQDNETHKHRLYAPEENWESLAGDPYTIKYLHNGIYAIRNGDAQELVLYDAASNEELQRFADVVYYQLLPEGGSTLLIQHEETTGITFYDLSSRSLGETQPNASLLGYCEGVGYLLYRESGNILVDQTGLLLQEVNISAIQSLEDGLVSIISRDRRWAGIFNQSGECLLWLQVNSED